MREILEVVKAPTGTKPEDALQDGIPVVRRPKLVGSRKPAGDGEFYELHVIVEFDSPSTGWVVFVEQVFGSYLDVADVT